MRPAKSAVSNFQNWARWLWLRGHTTNFIYSLQFKGLGLKWSVDKPSRPDTGRRRVVRRLCRTSQARADLFRRLPRCLPAERGRLRKRVELQDSTATGQVGPTRHVDCFDD